MINILFFAFWSVKKLKKKIIDSILQQFVLYYFTIVLTEWFL